MLAKLCPTSANFCRIRAGLAGFPWDSCPGLCQNWRLQGHRRQLVLDSAPSLSKACRAAFLRRRPAGGRIADGHRMVGGRPGHQLRVQHLAGPGHERRRGRRHIVEGSLPPGPQRHEQDVDTSLGAVHVSGTQC